MAATSLDYRDFSLVCKAFQLKENGPNGMICLCGLDKEDIIFSKDEESDIDSVNSWGLRVSPMINDFILLETIMVPTCDDDISSIEKLRKIFRDMSPYKRLVWCGRLLIEFHEENQGSRYLSSALKFYVKAIEYMRSVPVCQIFPDDTKIKELVKLSSKFRVHQSAFIELLRLFSTHGFFYLLSSPTIDYVLLLEDIFRATNELKIDILVLWKKVDNRSYLLFNDFVHKNIEAFIPLIKFGKTECISIESGEYLTSSFIRFPMSVTVNSDYRYNSQTSSLNQL
nr:uncharacterized protein LOC122270835 [Parasteatoda tepidariorum]